jgi:putative endonuclease
VAGRLTSAGYQVIDRNWRTRWGELDIVALQERLLVFVEVKARRSGAFGTADEAVSQAKLERVTGAAMAWLAEHDEYQDHVWRVDLVAVTLDRQGRVQHYAHYENLTVD